MLVQPQLLLPCFLTLGTTYTSSAVPEPAPPGIEAQWVESNVPRAISIGDAFVSAISSGHEKQIRRIEHLSRAATVGGGGGVSVDKATVTIDQEEKDVLDAAFRAQAEAARRHGALGLGSLLRAVVGRKKKKDAFSGLVSVGEIARQGIPLEGLEQRLFKLAAKCPARIVTMKDGSPFFSFEPPEASQSLRMRTSEWVEDTAPFFLFAAAESFFLFFPIPFFLLRLVAQLSLLKRWVETADGGERENYVERWARQEGRVRSKSAGERLIQDDILSLKAFAEEMWPWTKDPNKEILGIWRRRILAQLVVLRGGRLTAADMLPYLDPDPDKHKDVESFLADADGLAQPLIAELQGTPDWKSKPIIYNFPQQLRVEADASQGESNWLINGMRSVFKGLARSVGIGRVDLPSYIEELQPASASNRILNAQLIFCLAAAAYIPVAARLGRLGSRVGFMPTSVALRAWPCLLAIAAGLLLLHLKRIRTDNRMKSLVAFRNRLRWEAAWKGVQRGGHTQTIPLDLRKNVWYDTSESTESYDMRRFDENLKKVER